MRIEPEALVFDERSRKNARRGRAEAACQNRTTLMDFSSNRTVNLQPTNEYAGVIVSEYGLASSPRLLRFYAYATDTMNFTTWLNPGFEYDVYIDGGTKLGTYLANVTGYIEFNYSGPWSVHEFIVQYAGFEPPTEYIFSDSFESGFNN